MTDEEMVLAHLIDSIGSKMKKYLGGCSISEFGDFSLRDISIIDFIGKNKRTMGQIADDLNLTPGTVTPIVDRLIDNKILKRERDEEIDRRKVFISLDDLGSKIYQSHLDSKLKIANLMMSSFSKKDKFATIDLMRKIDENLNKTMED